MNVLTESPRLEGQRRSLARDPLLECLLQEIGHRLGKDAHYLGDKITIVSKEGQNAAATAWRLVASIVLT
jgi:hypothetical protein